jgi:phosphoglycolate phosphatase-like HAD superfamily hydrolase
MVRPKRLILFDIDGTLLWTRGAAKRAFLQAMIQVYGTAGPIATHAFGGKTDPQIARELLRLAGFADTDIDAGLPALWMAYTRELRTELQSPLHETVVLPGVRDLVARLAAMTDVLVGLVTGNIAQGAALKLASASLDGRFRLGAYGSDSEYREELPPVAVARARSLAGVEFRGRQIVVIGDTPADMTCGQSLDVHAVGVTTGTFDEGTLRAAGAHTVFPTLADTDTVVDALLG